MKEERKEIKNENKDEELDRLLSIRKVSKTKKPNFTRQDTHKKKKLGKRWKKPRGLHSKIRLCKKGYKRSVTGGWKSPRKVRGCTKEGLTPIRVHSLKDLKKISQNQGIIIAATVGDRKKKQLLEQIQKLNLNVINVKSIEKAIEKINEKLKLKKEKKKEAVKKKEKKKAEKKKQGKKEGLAEKIDTQETKPKEKIEEQKVKKEFDKLLTKRV